LIASDEARSAKVRRAAIRQQEENILPLGIPDRERPRLGSTRIVAPGRTATVSGLLQATTIHATTNTNTLA